MISALHDFYISLGGPYWRCISKDCGIPWDFASIQSTDASTVNRPCVDDWMGLKCRQNNETWILEGLFFELDNNLIGTIPKSISSLSTLRAIKIEGLFIGGVIPTTIADMPYVSDLFISSPGLLGKVFPFTKFSMPLYALHLSCGQCNPGPFPSEIQNFVNLKSIAFVDANLIGTIPIFLSKLKTLSSLNVANNSLTGPFPSAIFKLTELEILQLSGNLFHGPFPPDINNLSNLVALDMSYNSFSGTIPPSIGTISNIQIFSVAYNKLEGMIPSTMSQLQSLKYISIARNRFNGNIDSILNPSIQSNIISIDLNENKFTGALPSQFFANASKLSYFSASVNCFSGAIPSSICSSEKLEYLILDGINTAPECRALYINMNRYNAYYTKRKITGEIPECLFHMPDLKVLHLSNNGIKARLPELNTLGPGLINLALGNNFLVGSIPEVIQSRKSWQYLDVSFNMLDGVLIPNITMSPNATLRANVNRLSGNIPDSIHYFKDVKILSGNLFACNSRKKLEKLPVYDPLYRRYQCSSEDFNLSIIVWTVFFFAFLLFGVSIYCKFVSFINELMDTWDIAFLKIDSEKTVSEKNRSEVSQPVRSSSTMTMEFHNLSEFSEVMGKLRHTIGIILVALMIIYFPLYGIISMKYKAQTYRYAWTTSAMFLEGSTPAIILFAVFMAYMIGVSIFWLIRHGKSHSADTQTASNSQQALQRSISSNPPSISQSVTFRSIIITYAAFYGTLTLIIITNIICMSLVNYAFVKNSEKYEGNVNYVNAISAGVSLFKSVWTWGLIPKAFDIHQALFKFIEKEKFFMPSIPLIMLLIALVNILLIPIITVAATTTSCFYYVFNNQDDVNLSIFNVACLDLSTENSYNQTVSNICINSNSVVSSSPPFSYRYQCGSTIISQYAKVFIFQFLIETFGFPTFRFFTARKADPLLQADSVDEIDLEKDDSSESSESPSTKRPWDFNRLLTGSDQKGRPFNKDLFVVKCFTLTAICMTFGIVFPLIAVVGMIAIYALTYSTQYTLAMAWKAALDEGDSEALLLMHEYVKDLPHIIWQPSLLILPLSFIFYAIFIFDIFGDTSANSIWAPIVLVVSPIPLYYMTLLVDFGKFRLATFSTPKLPNLGEDYQDEYDMQSSHLSHLSHLSNVDVLLRGNVETANKLEKPMAKDSIAYDQIPEENSSTIFISQLISRANEPDSATNASINEIPNEYGHGASKREIPENFMESRQARAGNVHRSKFQSKPTKDSYNYHKLEPESTEGITKAPAHSQSECDDINTGISTRPQSDSTAKKSPTASQHKQRKRTHQNFPEAHEGPTDSKQVKNRGSISSSLKSTSSRNEGEQQHQERWSRATNSIEQTDDDDLHENVPKDAELSRSTSHDLDSLRIPTSPQSASAPISLSPMIIAFQQSGSQFSGQYNSLPQIESQKIEHSIRPAETSTSDEAPSESSTSLTTNPNDDTIPDMDIPSTAAAPAMRPQLYVKGEDDDEGSRPSKWTFKFPNTKPKFNY